MTDVSPAPGHGSIATPSVKAAPAHSLHSSRYPILESRFRGPFLYNETEEERKKREDDEQSKSNFKKVQEAREREAEARKKAEEERDALLKEKQQREDDDKKAREAKLADEKKFEELAKQKDDEAKAKSAEAATEKARADALESEVKAFKDQQEAELKELVETIPEDKRPPLDPTDSVTKRLSQVKYAKSLIETGKPPIGGGVKNKKTSDADRLAELKKKGMNNMTANEALEFAELTE